MTPADEALFVDTYVFLSATNRSRPQHEQARRLVERAAAGDIHLVLSGQIIREYLVVSTRPATLNGLGMSPEEALANVAVFAHPPFQLCEESHAVSARLQDLVRIHRLQGKRIHDANIVATMLVEGVNRLITDNVDDFAVFEEIETIALDRY